MMFETSATGTAACPAGVAVAPPPLPPADGERQDAPSFAQLLERHAAGGSLFASPRGTWLGLGDVRASPARPQAPAATHAEGLRRVSARVRHLLEDAANTANQAAAHAATPTTLAGPWWPAPLVMGAVPFDLRQPAVLRVPAQVLRGLPPVRGTLAAGGASGASPRSVVPDPAPAVYEQAVDAALARFAAGALDKVVLARTLALELDEALDIRSLLRRLAAINAQGYTYAVPLEATADGQPAGVFLGGTPELLVRRQGRRVIVNPLAGSAARGRDAQEDARIGQALMRSVKDRREHAVVIDAVAQALRPLCRTLAVPSAPSLLSTDALWHLSTVLEGELADEAITSLDLALALHPTPAVCGYPAAAAFDAIAALEPFDRGLFAGFVGWCDARGDGEWAVSLRCAQVRGRSVRLYAGAGIVPGSVPASETAETQTKFRTMLRALGIAPEQE